MVHLVSLVLVPPTTLVLLWVIAWVDEWRPGGLGGDIDVGFVLVGAAALVLLAGAHEAIHAGLFVVFGHSPRVRLRAGMIFVEASDGLLRRDDYILVLLAPLVLLTAVGLGTLFYGPPRWVPLVAVLLIVNTVGAAGDLVTTWRLLRVRRRALVRQTPGGLCVYAMISE